MKPQYCQICGLNNASKEATSCVFCKGKAAINHIQTDEVAQAREKGCKQGLDEAAKIARARGYYRTEDDILGLKDKEQGK